MAWPDRQNTGADEDAGSMKGRALIRSRLDSVHMQSGQWGPCGIHCRRGPIRRYHHALYQVSGGIKILFLHLTVGYIEHQRMNICPGIVEITD